MDTLTQHYSKKWNIHNLAPFPDLSINSVYKGISPQHGDIVLKIYHHDLRGNAQYPHEAAALSHFAGAPFCNLLDSDIENGVLLLECINPGTPLKDLPDLDDRLDVFLGLFKALHDNPVPPTHDFPTYAQWLADAADSLAARHDVKNLYAHMRNAQDVYADIVAQNPVQQLLHGDFHFTNILLDADGFYKVIDPKGVLGHPLFDLPRYILNEHILVVDDKGVDDINAQRSVINKIIHKIEESLGINRNLIAQSFYIETALAYAWVAQSGRTPKIERVLFAETVMKNME